MAPKRRIVAVDFLCHRRQLLYLEGLVRINDVATEILLLWIIGWPCHGPWAHLGLDHDEYDIFSFKFEQLQVEQCQER